MYRILALFCCLMALALTSSCARMDRLGAHYDAKQCPFCSLDKGKCSYCEGSKKCLYCGGTGKRVAVSPRIAEENVKGGSYNDACAFCAGKGVCTYCEGKGACWACKGTAEAGDWNFFQRYLDAAGKRLSSVEPSPAESVPSVATRQ